MGEVRSIRDYQREASDAAGLGIWPPDGYCLCGCGQKTTKAKGNEGDYEPGDYRRYVKGHAIRHKAQLERARAECEGVIGLGGGRVALVSEEDLIWLGDWVWHAVRRGERTYAARNASTEERAAGSSSVIYMHREIVGLRKGQRLHTDHRNGDGLDNRRENLRIATPGQNYVNKPGTGKSSEWKGVYWAGWTNRWRVKLRRLGGGEVHVGYFDDEIEAARAYDLAAQQEYGEFAWLNFPEDRNE